MYAWYWIEHGGKWPDADMVDNTCDQWYRPEVAYASTDKAVDDTWLWVLTRNEEIFQTRHRQSCQPPYCLGQQESVKQASQGSTWDEILSYFYPSSKLTYLAIPPAGFSLRFYGSANGGNRYSIPLFQSNQPPASLPVNVGSGDFTIEWWMRTFTAYNPAGSVSCGDNASWARGNILFLRGRPGASTREFGSSLAGGKLVFGVTGEVRDSREGPDPEAAYAPSFSLCGKKKIADGYWHHVAVQRAGDGRMWIFVDGQLDGFGIGPSGDVSYKLPVNLYSIDEIDQTAVLLIGGGYIGGEVQGYNGWLDELRISTSLRYGGSFKPVRLPFENDEDTAALYHFDEGLGGIAADSSGASLPPSSARRIFGGAPNGPDWQPSTLIGVPDGANQVFLPVIWMNKILRK